MKGYQLLKLTYPHLVLCTDGEWHDPSAITFGCGRVPKLYKSPAGAAAKQRSLGFATTVEAVER